MPRDGDCTRNAFAGDKTKRTRIKPLHLRIRLSAACLQLGCLAAQVGKRGGPIAGQRDRRACTGLPQTGPRGASGFWMSPGPYDVFWGRPTYCGSSCSSLKQAPADGDNGRLPYFFSATLASSAITRYEYRTARRASSQVRGRSSRCDRCSTLLTRSLTAPQ